MPAAAGIDYTKPTPYSKIDVLGPAAVKWDIAHQRNEQGEYDHRADHLHQLRATDLVARSFLGRQLVFS